MLTQNQSFTPHIREKLMTFTEGKDDLTDKIDFIVCLGGDGTLLYASSLFQQSVPPIMAFHLGSLGFLTPFEIDNFEQQITQVLEGILVVYLWKLCFIFFAGKVNFCFFLHKQNSLIGNRYMIYFFLLGHAALTLRSRLRCIVMKKTENSTNSSNRFVCFLKICVLSFWKSCYILFTFFI